MRWERVGAWQLAGITGNDFLGARTLLGVGREGVQGTVAPAPLGRVAKVKSAARAASVILAETAKELLTHTRWTVAGQEAPSPAVSARGSGPHGQVTHAR